MDTPAASLHAYLSASPPSLCLRTLLFRLKMNRDKWNTCLFYSLWLHFLLLSFFLFLVMTLKKLSKLCFSFLIVHLIRRSTACSELLTFTSSEIENTMLNALNIHKESQIGSCKVPYINHTCVVFPCWMIQFSSAVSDKWGQDAVCH